MVGFLSGTMALILSMISFKSSSGSLSSSGCSFLSGITTLPLVLDSLLFFFELLPLPIFLNPLLSELLLLLDDNFLPLTRLRNLDTGGKLPDSLPREVINSLLSASANASKSHDMTATAATVTICLINLVILFLLLLALLLGVKSFSSLN